MTLEEGVAPYQEDYGTDADPGAFPRTIRHGGGETLLESKPERVVCLELGTIDTMLELGMTPVGIVEPSLLPFTAEQEALLADVPRVETGEEVDLEAIIAAQADLVMADLGTEDQLSQIAPTVLLHRAGSGQVWREVFMMTVLSLGEEERGAAVVQRYEERIRKLNAALPTPRPSVSFIRVQSDSLRYMLRANFVGRILTDLGFPRPEAQNVDDFIFLNMSLETLGDYADANLIVVATDKGDEAKAFAQQMLESPIWQTLDAVKNDRVFLVDSATWIGGVGYGGAHRVLDDIATYFQIAE
ncbi:MAG: iron-siderophore ABC transporter substrate-binding protein [Thermomicrobiales bacterium]